MSAQKSNRSWKLVCGVLAAVTAYSWVRSPDAAVPPAAASSRAAHRGPLRINASALGVSSQQLVAQLLGSRDLAEMRDIAERLGLVGGDEVIDPLMPLVSDEREGVPELVIGIFGKVGTDHAVTVLIELAKDRRYHVANSATYALADTASAKAETFLIGLLERDPTYDLISAVEKLGTEGAVAILAHVAATASEEIQRYAFDALARIRTPASHAALRELMDSPSVATAVRAIDALEEIDDETLAKLVAIIKTGDSELGKSAVNALGRGGEAAGPVLVEVALDGTADLRAAAVRALGSVHSELAFATLTKLVEANEGEISEIALASIAKLETPEARELLISIAMADGPLADDAVSELANVNGADIDAALLVIAKSDSDTSLAAIGHLLERDHPEALAIVVARARTGDDGERYRAFEVLAEVGSQTAFDKLVELVRAEHGSLKPRALGLIASKRRGDPVVGELLRESLGSSTPGEATAAASALGGAGTDEARAALVSVLSSTDEDLLYTAVRALENYRLDDATASALARAADANPAVGGLVMTKLISMGSPHGTRLAETALRDEHPHIAMRAIESLRSIGNKASFKIIEDAVHTTEGDLRGAAVRALGESKDPRTVEIITSALDDSNPTVRENVAYALHAIGGDKARNALVGMSRSSDVDDRVAALQSLREEPDRGAQQRVKEMLRDPEPRVVQYAIYAMAGNSTGVGELRRLVLDGGTPYQLRYDAALALQRYDELDERTSAWLASSTNDYGD